MFLSLPAALAGPMDDPSAFEAGWRLRVAGTRAPLGADDRSPLSRALLVVGVEQGPEAPSAGEGADHVELAVARGDRASNALAWVARPRGGLSLGSLEPENNGGDVEAGLLSARLRAEGRLYFGPVELAIAPELEGELGAIGGDARLAEAWGGLHTDRWVVGFGLRDRWIGPGRHGSLMLTDHARPAPLGSVAWQGPAGDRLGAVRLEAGLGWLNGERGDVQNPGLLLIDARWAVTSWVELGATRMAIFGGEGRPTPDWGQLLVPTEPHIYDDPDLLLPDQNELAALDARVNLPVRALGERMGLSLPVDYVELWWQYGGEDAIARDLGPLPVPSLAGVANLFGAEVALGPVLVTAEGARVLDDTFRWYTGHRVYHDGFTQDGRVMGHPAGGDSLSAWGAITWMPGDWAAQLQVERRLRVGIVDAEGDKLFALSQDELRHRAGVSVWRWGADAWWKLGVGLERVQGADFVPGADGWAWRLSLSR